MYRVKDCCVYCTGGGCYGVEGQFTNGLYFLGDLEFGYMIGSKASLESNKALYLNDESSHELSKQIVKFKIDGNRHIDDNYAIEEIERIVERL